jgi:hypothetical protein
MLLFDLYNCVYTADGCAEPFSVQGHYSQLCSIKSIPGYNSILVTLTVIYLTVTKFIPLMFFVLGYALFNILNMWIFMISNDVLVTCIICVIQSTNCQSQSYLMTDSQFPKLSECQTSILDPRPIFLSPPWKISSDICIYFIWSALSDTRTGL